MNNVYKLSDVSKEYLVRYNEIVQDMNAAMIGELPSASISDTFIRQMIPHHEGAILMSENILKYTTDVGIQDIAHNIIESQTNSINQMNNMLSCCQEVLNSERDVMLYMNRFEAVRKNMMAKMESASAGNNINVDFIEEMIPHHEGAILLAQNVLMYDICPDLKVEAEQIITSQTESIKRLLSILNSYAKVK